MEGDSIQKAVEGIMAKSFLMEQSVASGIANLRSVARKIRPSVGKASVEAVAIALRRYREKAKRSGADSDKVLSELLARSRVRVRTGVSDFTLLPGASSFPKVAEIARKVDPGRGETLQIIFGQDATTLIVDSENHEEVGRLAKGIIMDERRDLAAVSIVTPKKVEGALGWVALVTRLLARNGINMIEMFSCYTETILIIEEESLARTLEVFRKAKG
jgi:hypothetical protein